MKCPSFVPKPLNRTSRGAGLILVIAVCAIVTLITGLMYSRYLIERHSLKNTIRSIQDGYSAEAGIKKAFYYLKADPEKGINWRTGNLWADTLIKDRVFGSINDEVSLSIIDDAGYLRIKSQCRNRTIEIQAAGILPDSLKTTLTLVSSKPLIINAGSRIAGSVRFNLEPRFQGGSMEGAVETNLGISLPAMNFKSFFDAIKYNRYLLATPQVFEKELYSPQNFSPANPLPFKKIFVNDAVLMDNNSIDSIWPAGTGLVITSTAEIQVSGRTYLSDANLLAIGPVKILDQTRLNEVRIYSETSIEIADEAVVSGILIAPEIKICGKAVIDNPGIIYTGPPFKTGIISIQDQAYVHACIIDNGNGKGFKIETGPDVKVEGLIYSLAPITHQGEFTGYIFCRTFFEPATGSDTVNTNILTGRILNPESNNDFPVPIIFSQIKNYIPIKWQEN